jgi:Repeat of unknown function (DUF5907)
MSMSLIRKSLHFVIATALAVTGNGALAANTSTINPAIPAAGSQIASAPIRGNFQAAYNDINNLYSIAAGYTVGPNSAISGDFASFNGTTGSLIRDSGVNASTFLHASNNLSDVASPTTALINLLPNQSGNTGAVLMTNGTADSWGLLTTANFATNVVDNDPTMAADSSTRIPTQQAVYTLAQNLLSGLSWKAPVLCATTVNITLSGEQTIDGVTTSSSRVLVKNESTASQDGIYTSGSGAWTRTSDANSGSQLVDAAVFVSQGTTNANTQWVQATPGPITIGTTNLMFNQIGASTTYTNGTGLLLSGNQFSVDSMVVATLAGTQTLSNKSISGASNTLSNVPASALTGTVSTSQIGSSQVTYAKLQNETASTLLGNSTGSATAPSEITLGTGLAFSGSMLNATGTFTPLPTTVVTGTSQSMAVNNSYIANNSGLVTLTLPSAAAVGSVINVGGLGAGGWQIAQNAGQTINFGGNPTTAGTGGYIASNNQYDNITLQCVVANTTFVVQASLGTLTIH